MAKESKWWLSGRKSEPRPPGCRVTTLVWAFLFTPMYCTSVTKQYNLVLADGRWLSAAGKVTAGLAKSNGSLLPDALSHLWADCQYTGISSGPNARKRVWENFTVFTARRLAKRGICRRRVSVCLSVCVCVCVCVCHTPVLYQNG